jgi:hypothetical protein
LPLAERILSRLRTGAMLWSGNTRASSRTSCTVSLSVLKRFWPMRERKRILRLLVEDVTLIKAEKITAHVRLSGGAIRTLSLERPLPIAQIRKLKPELVAEVDHLRDHHCDREIAETLNQRGLQTWEGKPFNLKKIAFIRTAYKLASRTNGCAAAVCSPRVR